MLLSCNDDLVYKPGEGGDTDPLDGEEGWCAVQALFQQSCVTCHSAAALGDLDLATDPYTTLINQPSAGDPTMMLVVPGDPDASALYRKIIGSPPFGGNMPPGAPLTDPTVEAVRLWIADGATDLCDTPIDTGIPPDRHHPVDFAAADQHGWSAKQQEEECIDCHGATLEGSGPAVSCDTCHAVDWRTDCTFCHGDPTEGSGSPPLHISGEDDAAAATFIPHLEHVHQTEFHRPFDCTECHAKPTDVLSIGHLFVGDSTNGRAEADFSQSISDAGTWNGNGNCSNLWCHGNGRGNNGSIAHTDKVETCHACHPDRTSGEARWSAMSGEHEKHLDEGIGCQECHGDTVSDSTTIASFDLHINGVADQRFAGTIVRTAGKCTGACHGEGHSNESW